MSTITRTLPGIDTQFFAKTQNVAEDAFVNLNGNGMGNSSFPYQDGGYYRNLSFTSTDDLSAATIVVHGTGINGFPITESISGPNNNTVSNNSAFSRITQIQVTDAAATNLSIGSGPLAVIPYQFDERINTAFKCSTDSFGASISNPDNISVSVYGTYNPFITGEIKALLDNANGGAFMINNTINSSYRLSSSDTRGVAAIYFLVTMAGGNPMTVNIFTA